MKVRNTAIIFLSIICIALLCAIGAYAHVFDRFFRNDNPKIAVVDYKEQDLLIEQLSKVGFEVEYIDSMRALESQDFDALVIGGVAT